MPESTSISSWALNHVFTHNNVSGISHSPSVNAQKHDIYFHNSGNLCGALLGHKESSSAYPLMTLPMRRPVIKLSFVSIADTLREEFAHKRCRLYKKIYIDTYIICKVTILSIPTAEVQYEPSMLLLCIHT